MSSERSSAFISFREVGFGFGSEVLFDRLSLDVPRNAFFAIVGRSGSGKTTFLRLVSGALKPNNGSISIGGMAPREARSKRMLAVCPQSPALLPWLNVRRNVEFAFRMWGVPVDHRKIDWALEAVDLRSAERKLPTELSGGMRARVALARAWVAPGSEVLLMDESFAAVDEITREDLGAVLARMWREERRTVLYVTHVIPEAITLATHLWPLASEERRGTIEPLPITEEHRSTQRARGRSILHQVILSILGDGALSRSILDTSELERLRPWFSADELAPALAILEDPRFSSVLKINLIQLMEPFLSDRRASPEVQQRVFLKMREMWGSARDVEKCVLLFRILQGRLSPEEAAGYLGWALAAENRAVFTSMVRAFLGDRSLVAHVRSRLTSEEYSWTRKCLQVSTLIASRDSEHADVLSLLEELERDPATPADRLMRETVQRVRRIITSTRQDEWSRRASV